VKRMALYNACKWCRSLAGTYFYNEVKATGNDVWRRHRSCRCYVIDYHPGKKPRNAHTKEYLQEFDEDSQEGSKYEVNKDNRDLGKLGRLVEYKKINVDWNLVSKHTKEKMQERNVLKKDIEKWINEGYLVEQIKDYKYVYVSDDGVVVIDKYGKIITVWSKDFFDENMINKIRKIKRGF
ncbi:MAG: DUF4258 domain-containing protein, partial [Finegoldia sp.]|nr:DUF4258 domain-containing protein [Finegoldia sp.]